MLVRVHEFERHLPFYIRRVTVRECATFGTLHRITYECEYALRVANQFINHSVRVNHCCSPR